MRKILSAVLAIVLCISLCSCLDTVWNFFGGIEAPKETDGITTPAEEEPEILPGEPSIGLTYVSNGDGTCAITGIGTCIEREIIIPLTSPKGDKVIKIAPEAFKATEIESVYVPSSVIEISEEAFLKCKKLKRIELQNGLQKIGESAFRFCEELEELHLPDSVSEISAYVMDNCKKVKKLTISKSLVTIPEYTFSACYGLTEVVIPTGVTSIGMCAFLGCESITKLVIPETVKVIEHSAFTACLSLTDLSLPDGIERIGPYAFSMCIGLKSVEFSKNLKTIGTGAFRECTSLRSVTMPNSISNLPSRIFEKCSSLSEIYIHKDIVDIDPEAFNRCPLLNRIVIEKGNPIYTSNKSCLIDKNAGKVIRVYNLSDIPADGSVTSIGDYALLGVSAEKIVVPDFIREIGSRAFEACRETVEIVLPKGLLKIGDNAFSSCYQLRQIIFGGTMEEWRALVGNEQWFLNNETECIIQCSDGTIDPK